MFWGAQLGRAKPRGAPGEKHLKDLGIFTPEIAANASNLTTSSYIWRTHLLLLFSFHLSKIFFFLGGGGLSPSYGPAHSFTNFPSWESIKLTRLLTILQRLYRIFWFTNWYFAVSRTLSFNNHLTERFYRTRQLVSTSVLQSLELTRLPTGTL